MSETGPQTGLDILICPKNFEAALWRRSSLESDVDAREQLFTKYMPLAHSISRKYYNLTKGSKIPYEDIQHFSYTGLLQAIDRFDPLRGAKFGSFARLRISGAIKDGMSVFSERSSVLTAQKTEERIQSMKAVRGLEPNISMLSEIVTDIAMTFLIEEAGLYAQKQKIDQSPSPFESLNWQQVCQTVLGCVDDLPKKENTVIVQHYINDVSFVDIATLLRLTKGRISQIHSSAIYQLRDKLKFLR